MRSSRLFTALALSTTLAACGVPTNEATLEQREADLAWVFATFDRNYAPLEWKEKNLGVNFEAVKKECYEKNKTIKTDGETNNKFRALVFECVSKFKDAHTGALQSGDLLPGKAKIAYLGFKTKRSVIEVTENDKTTVTEALKIYDFLPTTDPNEFPLKIGDLITAVDGRDIKTVLLEDIAPYSDLGQESSNLTNAARVFAVRSSMLVSANVPDDVTLTVKRDSMTFDVKLPWGTKDLFTFAREQKEAAKQKSDLEKEKQKSGENSAAPTTPKKTDIPDLMTALLKNLQDFLKSGQFSLTHIRFMLENTFRVPALTELDAGYRFIESLSGSATAEEKKKETPERVMPGVSYPVVNEKFPNARFPSYELMSNGKRYLYIRVSDFGLAEEDLKQFAELLIRYRNQNYDGLVLDLLNNGGGSLVLGGRMLNMLTDKAIIWPTIQLRLNDSWVDSFESAQYFAPSDAERTWASRISKVLQEDKGKTDRLSRPISVETLDPYASAKKLPSCKDEQSPNDPKNVCLKSGTPIVLLVNEMCASMCDIFASMFKDNKLGIVAGEKTMGAGGNVVMHAASPASLIMLRQTESLLRDAAGNYLENNGVEPDERLSTVNDKDNGYSSTLSKALDLFSKL